MSFNKFGEDERVTSWTKSIQELMEEMQKRSFVDFRKPGCWQPATNVFETRSAYHVCVELAGVERSQIGVETLSNRLIMVTGIREQPRPAAASGPLSVHALEIDEGPFRREVELPEPVKVDAIEATYARGYLWITLPKISG